MPIAAGKLNRRAQFQRRAPMPAAGQQRGGFVDHGGIVWAAYTERRPRDLIASGLTMTARTATLAIRDCAWGRAITRADRVAIDGDVFDVTANALADRVDGVLRFDLVEAQTPAMYAREMDQRGSVVTLKRGADLAKADVRAILIGYTPQEMTGDLQQGDVRCIFMAEDLQAAITAGVWPAGAAGAIKAKSTDAIWQDGRKMTVQAVDDQTRRIAGELIAYELRVRG